MAEQAPPWPKSRDLPRTSRPSRRSTGARSRSGSRIIADCGLEKHMAIVGYLKSEHGMGHGHANALVGWTLAGNIASP